MANDYLWGGGKGDEKKKGKELEEIEKGVEDNKVEEDVSIYEEGLIFRPGKYMTDRLT